MKLKRVFVWILLVMLLSSTQGRINVIASENQISTNILAPADERISTFAEESQWFYREVDGKAQKRLWSITNNIWLTDWQWV